MEILDLCQSMVLRIPSSNKRYLYFLEEFPLFS
jgi:hypothetical protein